MCIAYVLQSVVYVSLTWMGVGLSTCRWFHFFSALKVFSLLPLKKFPVVKHAGC